MIRTDLFDPLASSLTLKGQCLIKYTLQTLPSQAILLWNLIHKRSVWIGIVVCVPPLENKNFNICTTTHFST